MRRRPSRSIWRRWRGKRNNLAPRSGERSTRERERGAAGEGSIRATHEPADRPLTPTLSPQGRGEGAQAWCVLRLLHLHARPLDHLAPLRVVRLDPLREIVRTAGDREDEARREEFLAERRLGEDALRLGAEPVDDRARRAGRRDEAVPRGGLVAGQRL